EAESGSLLTAHVFAFRGFERRIYSAARSIGYMMNEQLHGKLLSARANNQTLPGAPTRIANPPGHGKVVVKVVPRPAAIPKFVRQQSVFSVLLPTGGCPPTFGGTCKIQVTSPLKFSGFGSK